DHRRLHLGGDVGKADRVRRFMRIDLAGEGAIHAAGEHDRQDGDSHRRCATEPTGHLGSDPAGMGFEATVQAVSRLAIRSGRLASGGGAMLVLNVSRWRMVPHRTEPPHTGGPHHIGWCSAGITMTTRTMPIAPLGPWPRLRQPHRGSVPIRSNVS